VTRSRGLTLVVLVIGVALGAAGETASSASTGWKAGDFAVGCVLLGCGALAWDRRSDSRSGPLLTLAGLTWFLGTVSSAAVYLHRGPLVQLVVAYPTGRLRGRLARVFVVGVYVAALVQPYTGGNLLTLAVAAGLVVFACSALVVRHAAVPATAALALAGAFALAAANRLESLNRRDLVLAVYDGVVAAVALGLAVDLLRGRRTEAALRGLVVDLGSISGTSGLRDRLAVALGDPLLVLGYRLKDTGALVDDDGRPIALPPEGSARTVARLQHGGEEIGVLVHDAALASDPELVESVAAAAQIAMVNARLQAEAREQARALAESRRRIVESSDRERRRLARDLHLGPERRLDDASAHLALAARRNGVESIKALGLELEEAQRELRSFAQGVRPPVLAEGGLMPALEQLANHSPIPVATRGATRRLPEAVEAALFFVCSEGLANAVKHSQATRVTVEVGEARETARVAVIDDGIGGANVGRGAGLAGLADRIEALGGTLRLDSPAGAGTHLVAEVPISARASRAP
jgi:signal transduction histidine kinase